MYSGFNKLISQMQYCRYDYEGFLVSIGEENKVVICVLYCKYKSLFVSEKLLRTILDKL